MAQEPAKPAAPMEPDLSGAVLVSSIEGQRQRGWAVPTSPRESKRRQARVRRFFVEAAPPARP